MSMMTFLQKWLRWERTVWQVPPAQLWARVWARIKRVYHQTPLYPLLLERELYSSKPALSVTRLKNGNADKGTRLANDNEFMFVGRTVRMEKQVAWLPTEASPLWVFSLHYWEWLADLKAANRREDAQRLVEDWLLSCDTFHPTIWHPYPTSLRLVSAIQMGELDFKRCTASAC